MKRERLRTGDPAELSAIARAMVWGETWDSARAASAPTGQGDLGKLAIEREREAWRWVEIRDGFMYLRDAPCSFTVPPGWWVPSAAPPWSNEDLSAAARALVRRHSLDVGADAEAAEDCAREAWRWVELKDGLPRLRPLDDAPDVGPPPSWWVPLDAPDVGPRVIWEGKVKSLGGGRYRVVRRGAFVLGSRARFLVEVCGTDAVGAPSWHTVVVRADGDERSSVELDVLEAAIDDLARAGAAKL